MFPEEKVMTYNIRNGAPSTETNILRACNKIVGTLRCNDVYNEEYLQLENFGHIHIYM